MTLTETETKNLLMPYADGELSHDEAQAVEAALATHPALRGELDELRSIHAFARDAFEAPVADVQLDGVYDAVMARIAAEDRAAAPAVVREAESAGVWQRFTTWLGELVRFERPLALAGMAAAIVAVVVGATMFGGAPAGAPVAPGAELAVKTTPGSRRAPEGEHKSNGRNTAYVESWEVAKGKVIIDVNHEDPDQPMVLWHVVEDEGTVTPKGL